VFQADTHQLKNNFQTYYINIDKGAVEYYTHEKQNAGLYGGIIINVKQIALSPKNSIFYKYSLVHSQITITSQTPIF